MKQEIQVLKFFKDVKLTRRQEQKVRKIDTAGDQVKYISTLIGTRISDLKVNVDTRRDFEAYKEGMSNMGIQKFINHDFFGGYSDRLAPPANIPVGEALGVEIEFFIHKDDVKKFNKRLALRKLKDNVKITTDSSLNNGSLGSTYRGYEIRLVDNVNTLKVLEKVCKSLESIRTEINETCGLHVHFDHRQTDYNGALKNGERVAKAVKGLRHMLPKSRREGATYCGGTISTRDGRSSFVNLDCFNRQQTIEIRAHGGSVDFTKISNWIKINKVIIDDTRETPELNTIESVIEYYNFGDELDSYMRERAENFA